MGKSKTPWIKDANKMPWEQDKEHKDGWTKESRDGFYNTVQWKNTRKLVLSKSPLCVMCFKKGKVKPATDVDHILEVEDRPDLAYSIENLQPLCKSCHQVKRNIRGTKRDPANLKKGRDLMNELSE